MNSYYLRLKDVLFRNKNFGVEVLQSSIFRVGVVGINFITGFMISRDLLETNRGLFQIYLTSLTIAVTVFSFGLSGSATYYAGKEYEKIHKLFSLFFVVIGVSSLLVILFAYIGSLLFHSSDVVLRNLFTFSFYFMSFSLFIRGVLVGMGKNVWIQKVDFYTRCIYLLFVIALHYFQQMTVFHLVLFFTLEVALFTFLSLKAYGFKIFPLDFDLSFIRETFTLNSKIYILYILNILLLRSDQYIIKEYMGNYNLGLYSVGSSMVEQLSIIANMIASIFVARLLSQENLNINLNKAKKALLLLFFTSLGISIVVYFLSPYIVEFSFKKYHPNADLSLRILLIGFIFWSLYSIVYMVYLSMRVKKTFLLNLFIVVVLNIVLNFYYVPKYGFVSSAIISAFTYGLLFVLSYIDIFYLKKKNYNKRLKEHGDS